MTHRTPSERRLIEAVNRRIERKRQRERLRAAFRAFRFSAEDVLFWWLG